MPLAPTSRYVARRVRHASAGAILSVMVSLMLMPGATAQQAKTPKLKAGQCILQDATGAQSAVQCTQAWFWDSNERITVIANDPALGAAPEVSISDGASGGTPRGVGSPISDQHIAVGLKDGSSDMRAYIKFDTPSIPFGSEISKYEITLKTSRSSEGHGQDHAERSLDPPGTLNADDAVIQACAITSPFFAGAQGDPPYSTTIERKADDPSTPEDEGIEVEVTSIRTELNSDCSLQAIGVRSGDGSSYTFDITDIAKKWFAGELSPEGIALHPVPQGIKTTWTVEFHGNFSTITNAQDEDVAIVTPDEVAVATVEFTAPPPPPPPPPPLPPTGPTDEFPTFGDPAPVLPPPDPVLPPADDGSGDFVPIASNPRTPGWLYGLIPLGLLGLSLVSSAIGPEATGPGAANRVASVLRGRRLGGNGPSDDTTEVPRVEE